jgi:hypothetical protein
MADRTSMFFQCRWILVSQQHGVHHARWLEDLLWMSSSLSLADRIRGTGRR